MADIEDIGEILRTSEVISVSRRTDVPAFHMDSFLDAMKAGAIKTHNPYSGAFPVFL